MAPAAFKNTLLSGEKSTFYDMIIVIVDGSCSTVISI
jgi:hypothetical protein